jgi:leader peptidase (prepilin peptidase) / N-methyltransferase
MQYILGVIIFLFGSALGSFIAVIANRYNTGMSFLRGRSVCFSCNHELASKDLVPLLSFLSLGGKCRYCASKIPKETLMIEILMGILSILAALKLDFVFKDFSLLLTANYLLLTAIFAAILLISIYDLKHFIIPDSFLISLFILSLLHNSLFIIHNSSSFSYLILNTYPIILSLASGLILALPFLLIFLISKGTWFGFGDVKYIAVLGFFLGFVQGLSAVILSFWVGAAFSLVVLSLKKLTPRINLPLLKNNLTIKSEIPFGPFLSIGIIISFCLSLDLFQINALLNFF